MTARCYACDGRVIGHALRHSDGGPAHGEDDPSTVAVPGCHRHAYDPYDHPAVLRLGGMPAARVAPCTVKRAIEFAAAHHRHSEADVGGLWAVKLIRVRRTIGVALVGRPKARLLDDGFTAEVTRLCAFDLEMNACSLLYGRCKRAAQALGYDRIVTYTLATESGASLRGAGWREVADVRAEDWDRPGRRRKPRPALARVRWEVQLGVNTAPGGAV